MCDTECYVLLLQIQAVIFLLLTWAFYRKAHPANQPRFQIERVEFYGNKQVVFYCTRRGLLNQWRTFEIEKGVRGYKTETQARKALEGYLSGLGLDMTETTIRKSYG